LTPLMRLVISAWIWLSAPPSGVPLTEINRWRFSG
jgi:hypothetical protein